MTTPLIIERAAAEGVLGPMPGGPNSTDFEGAVRPGDSWWKHYLALAILSLVVGIAFISPPGFGDEFTYWTVAFDLHEIGRHAWNVHSFHDLRWPVWGVLWLWQALFGAGLASIYCEPMLYLAAASALAFTFGRIVLRSIAGAWTCAISLLYAPVLDSVVFRPMPDLSEAVFGGCALLCWWNMMQAEKSTRAALFGVLSGISIGLAFSNRVTGIFIAPVLLVATLVFFPRRWQWLTIPALVAAGFFLVECAVYYWVCGDWLHSIHANLGGRLAKDVEVMPLWRLPLRYLSGFFRGNRLAPIYGGLTLIGLWVSWRRWGRVGRLMVVWLGVLYLEYSCAIQSLHPVRPLIGSTFRYLATLVLPMSVIIGVAAIDTYRFLEATNWSWVNRVTQAAARAPRFAVAGIVLFLSVYSSRPFFDLGYIPALRRYMASQPAGTRIFSHHGMYDAACLADPTVAHRFTWIAPKHILLHNEELEQQASTCEQLWTVRKLLWLLERKEVEHDLPRVQPQFGTYITNPQRDWTLVNILAKDDEPSIVFYRRRTTASPPLRTLAADAPELHDLLPPLPAVWNAQRHKRIVNSAWIIPSVLRGKLVNLAFEAASAGVEPMTVKLRFSGRQGADTHYELRPILYAGGGEDHFALPIPANAETCAVETKFTRKTNEVRLFKFQLTYDDPQ